MQTDHCTCPPPPWVPPANSVFLPLYPARAGQQQHCRQDRERCSMRQFPVAGTSFSLLLTRMWSGTAYFAILEATIVLSSSLIWSTQAVCSFSTMKAKAPGRQMSRSHKHHTRYWKDTGSGKTKDAHLYAKEGFKSFLCTIWRVTRKTLIFFTKASQTAALKSWPNLFLAPVTDASDNDKST